MYYKHSRPRKVSFIERESFLQSISSTEYIMSPDIVRDMHNRLSVEFFSSCFSSFPDFLRHDHGTAE